MAIGRFLAGISSVIWSPDTAHYLLLHRAAERDYAPGIWECLTGRVEQGEGFEDALQREAHEELGVTIHPVFILGTTHFYRGAPVVENELLGVVYLSFLPETTPITISPEHSEYRWLDARQAFELLSASDLSTGWAYRVIKRAESTRPFMSGDLASFNRTNGFELG